MRAEVGLVSSNVIITAADGPTTYVRGTGELFGARLVVAGNATARISHVSGVAGLMLPTGRPCSICSFHGCEAEGVLSYMH